MKRKKIKNDRRKMKSCLVGVKKERKENGSRGVHSGRPFFAIAFWEGKGKDNGMEKTITKSTFNF